MHPVHHIDIPRIVGEMVMRVRLELGAKPTSTGENRGMDDHGFGGFGLRCLCSVYSPGPHIPDSPGTGSVSVFFVDPSGKAQQRKKNGSS